MDGKAQDSIHLSGRDRRTLRALGHHLKPVVLVGREGITPALIRSAGQALSARELIKVKLGQNCPLAKKEAARQLAAQCGAALVQLIGKTVLLYRPNPDLDDEKRIGGISIG